MFSPVLNLVLTPLKNYRLKLGKNSLMVVFHLNVSNVLIGGTAVPTMNRGKVHIQYNKIIKKQTVLSGASAHSPFNRRLTCRVRSVTQPHPTLRGTRNDFCIINAKQKCPALVVGVV